MLTADYHLAGLSLAGATRPGRQQLAINISRLPLASPSRITQTQVQVSFDRGRTWRSAIVTRLAASRFRVVFRAPAGTNVSLRTHAADAAGDTITETMLDGYRTS